MQLIDIGVNLTNKRLRYDAARILQESAEQNVTKMVVTGTSLEHSRLAIELCGQFPQQLACTAGVHPHDAKDWDDDAARQLSTLIEHSCVRAVGETGLDFNRNFSPQAQQIEVFQQQLELAVQYGKPVFLHQRDAFDTFHQILKEFRDRLQNAVVHCFTDDKPSLYRLLDLDCHIGVTGWICDERRGQDLQQAVGNIPHDRLMLETDAPYLLPRDLDPKPADKTNYPKFLPHILQTVARLQGKSPEQLAEEVFETTIKFFRLQV
jgi:TatD DNase family protein